MKNMKNTNIPWLGYVPENWELKKIKYTLQERIEKNNPVKSENILSLTAKQGVIPHSEKEGGGNKPKEDFSAYRLAYPGDIVMNSMNILSGSVGLSKYFGCVSPVYYMLRPSDKNHDVRFYNYIFQSTVFQRSLFGLGNGILIKESGNGKLNTIRMRIPMDKFGQLFIPVAPIIEQHRIADFLDAKCEKIDAITSDIEDEITTLEKYKKSEIFKAVSKGVDNTSLKSTNSDVWTEIPESWKLADIKYLFEIVKRIAGEEGYEILSVTQRGLKIKDISNNEGQIANNYSGYQFVYPTDYVMNHMDLLTGWVDCSSMFGVTSPDYRVFRLRDKNNNNLEYYKYVMQCCYLCRIFYSLGQGVSNLGRWRLQTSSFMNFLVPVPPIAEQEHIAEYLSRKISEIDATIELKQAQLDTLAEYKKSLIYEYVTGKKEVPADV